MLPVFKNSWFPTVFDEFFDNDLMPRANTTAPAVNVKEDDKAYTMELAAPGIRKEFCRVNINEDGNLKIAIENKTEHKDEDSKHHYLRREFSYANYEQNYTLPGALPAAGRSTATGRRPGRSRPSRTFPSP